MPPWCVKSPATFSKSAKWSSNQNGALPNSPEVFFVAATRSHQIGMTK
jgi:hypothetical protein